MKDTSYIKAIERLIIQALKPFKAVPMNLVYRAYGIKVPRGMKTKNITLGDFVRQSKM